MIAVRLLKQDELLNEHEGEREVWRRSKGGRRMKRETEGGEVVQVQVVAALQCTSKSPVTVTPTDPEAYCLPVPYLTQALPLVA